MKTVETLTKGEVLLTQVRKIKGGKYQIELAEIIVNEENINVAGILNAGDDRFTSANPKARRAWESGTPQGIKDVFGIDVTKLKFSLNALGQEIAPVNKLNPTYQGKKICIKLTDSLSPSFPEQTPKQSGENAKGEAFYFMKDGKHIYGNSAMSIGEAKHSIILSDERVLIEVPVATEASSALNRK